MVAKVLSMHFMTKAWKAHLRQANHQPIIKIKKWQMQLFLISKVTLKGDEATKYKKQPSDLGRSRAQSALEASFVESQK